MHIRKLSTTQYHWHYFLKTGAVEGKANRIFPAFKQLKLSVQNISVLLNHPSQASAIHEL